MALTSSRLRCHGTSLLCFTWEDTQRLFTFTGNLARDLYEADYSKAYYNKAKRIYEKRFSLWGDVQLRRIELCRPYLTKKTRCLEIGSNIGYFLYQIKDQVKSILGLELNRAEARWAEREKGIPTISSSIFNSDAIADGSVDLIAMFQVIEHIPEPIEFLRQVFRKLAPGGLVIIETPNLLNPMVSLYRIPAFRNFWF